jgi:GTP-binding protein HflX
VEQVLQELGVDVDNPLLVLNKVDAVQDHSYLDVLRAKYPQAVSLSARQGLGLDRLAAAVGERLGNGYVELAVDAHVGNGRLLAFLEQHAEIRDRHYIDSRVRLECRVPRRFAGSIGGDDVTVTPVNGRRTNGQAAESLATAAIDE